MPGSVACLAGWSTNFGGLLGLALLLLGDVTGADDWGFFAAGAEDETGSFDVLDVGDPTVDLPTKIAPGSTERTFALMSPTTSAVDFRSTRSAAVMFPCTLPYTTTVEVLISALILAFSPTVRLPFEAISPSMRPSITKSLVNFTVPLISTSEDRMFLVPEEERAGAEGVGEELAAGAEALGAAGEEGSGVCAATGSGDSFGSWPL